MTSFFFNGHLRWFWTDTFWHRRIFPAGRRFLVEKFISEHGAEAFDEVSNWLPGAM